jgi:hypothetical protein
LAMIATPLLRLRVGIETCAFSTCTKTWVYLVASHDSVGIPLPVRELLMGTGAR